MTKHSDSLDAKLDSAYVNCLIKNDNSATRSCESYTPNKSCGWEVGLNKKHGKETTKIK